MRDLRRLWSSTWHSRPFVVGSPLTVDEALQQLRTVVMTRRDYVLGRAYRGLDASQIPLVGQVAGTEIFFRTRAVTLYGLRGRSVAPMRGLVMPVPTGCQLVAEFSLQPAMRFFIPFWFLGALTLGSTGVVAAAMGPDKGVAPFIAFIVLAFLVGGFLNMSQMFEQGLRDEKEIRRRLVVLLGGWELTPRTDL